MNCSSIGELPHNAVSLHWAGDLGCRLKRGGKSGGMERGSGAIAMTLLLLLPIPHSQFFNDELYGEIIIENENGWSVNEWNDLEDEGIQPIRQLSKNELLAWGPLNDYNIPNELNEYRGEITNVEQFLVIFEPRLNDEIRNDLIEMITGLGINTDTIYNPSINSPLPQITIITPNSQFSNWWSEIENMHGIHWIEPILETNGRNYVSASIMQNGEINTHPAWLLGLDGNGIIIANADSGIDRDHECFREATEPGASGSEWNNATGTPGQSHRKILILNETIDDWDSPNHKNYQHGTHIAGSLSCRSVWEISAENNGDWVNSTPGEGTSIAHGSKLIIEDVVNGSGWNIPPISDLFWEAANNGAIIRSDSWGDDTTDYTTRTSQFDTWLYQIPWSISFVAPGNTGGEILEPANGLNVVSVGVSAKDGSNDLWTLSPRELTAQGKMGVTIVVPGENIISAKSDGAHSSNNGEYKSSTGTSMAAPQAAAYAAIIQQMVEEGWLSNNESRTKVTTDSIRPNWAEYVNENLSSGELLLGEGFVPSGALIKALMTLSADSLEGGRQAEIVLDKAPNNQQGWGRVNLSNLINFEKLEVNIGEGVVEPAENIWVHDSFRLYDNDWQGLVKEWLGEGDSYSATDHYWNGDGAVGPFLSNDEFVEWDATLIEGEDLAVQLVWNSAPNIDLVDDLDLQVILPDGRIYLGNDFENSGLKNETENIEGVRINSSNLIGIETVKIKIIGENVNIGPSSGVIGLNGDKIGFAIAAKGIDRKSVYSKNMWPDNDKVVEQGGVFTLEKNIVLILITTITIISLIVIDRVRFSDDMELYLTVTKGQPSNHEGSSLQTAVAAQTGDDDE